MTLDNSLAPVLGAKLMSDGLIETGVGAKLENEDVVELAANLLICAVISKES